MALAQAARAQEVTKDVTQNTPAATAQQPAATTQQPAVAGEPPLPDRKTLPRNEWYLRSLYQSTEQGKIQHLWGGATIINSTLMVKADEFYYDEENHRLLALGNVYFHQFERNEQLWCDELEYDTETGLGRFYGAVRGETMPKVTVRKGVLSGNSPFHFEGEWAERLSDPTYDYKYVLHDGWITNCKIPKPWWHIKGRTFDIIPYDRAIAYKSTFFVKNFPLLIIPVPFYHSLKKEERKSGFLFPNLVPHSQRGFMVGLGYYWAINPSYDLTYRFQDYNTNAFGHHVEFRGTPKVGSAFDLIVSGNQDVGGDPRTGSPPTSGVPDSGTPRQRYSGVNIYFAGKADLGNGWAAGGLVDYVSSFRFKQEWSESFNDAIGSELHSVAFVKKDFSNYTFDLAASRTENFQQAEIQSTNFTAPGEFVSYSYTRDAVIIHKLPEAEFSGRNRRIWKNLPVWFSFDSSAGLLYRLEPVFDSTNTTVVNTFETNQFTTRLRFAPRISTAFHWLGMNFTPSVGLDETYYGESQTAQVDPTYNQLFYHVRNSDITRTAHDFTLDIALPSFARVFDKKTFLGDKLKHVIEPRVTYKYLTGIGTDFNNFIRFDENDLLANTNELTLSLTNRIYAKRGDNVQEILTWELKQKRYFDPTFGGALLTGQRNVFAATADITAYAFLDGPRTYSPIASILRANPAGGLTLQWQADYDPRYGRVVDSLLDVGYQWKKYHASIGDNEVHSNTILTPFANQYHFTVGIGDPQHRGWNAASSVAYDVRKNILQYATTQVTYNTDCCGFSVEYRRINAGLRDDTQWFVAFGIANVGTFGTLKKQDRLF